MLKMQCSQVLRVFLPLLLCVLTAASVQADDGRKQAFAQAAKAFVQEHRLPDGEKIEQDIIGDFSQNLLAVYDVDGDGQVELLVRFVSASESAKQEFVCGYNPQEKSLSIKFMGSVNVEYYNNGYLKEPAGRNRSLSRSFWPYTIWKYDKASGSYESQGMVHAWSRKEFPKNNEDLPYPTKIDTTNEGLVYFIDDENFKAAKGQETPVSATTYRAWVKHYFDGAEKLTIPWKQANAEGLKALTK